MKTIEIYCNYGVLAAEKRNVYTFGGPHEMATCSDKMTVAIPEEWELYETTHGNFAVTAPWGWDYLINEVLAGNTYPYFRAYDTNMTMRQFRLEIVNN